MLVMGFVAVFVVVEVAMAESVVVAEFDLGTKRQLLVPLYRVVDRRRGLSSSLPCAFV